MIRRIGFPNIETRLGILGVYLDGIVMNDLRR